MLTIVTQLKEKPGVRIEFKYEIFNQHDELLTEAETSLIFMDMEKMKPMKCPANLLEKLGY